MPHWIGAHLRAQRGVSSFSRQNFREVLKALRHPVRTVNYLKHHITNAVTEELNSKSPSIKAADRGFRNFRNYRVRIPFFCGKLDLYPP